jgi:hypothetical protein
MVKIMIYCFIPVLLLCALTIGTNTVAQDKASNKTTTGELKYEENNISFIIKFEQGTLYIKSEGVNSLTSFLSNDSTVNLIDNIILIPMYCIEEADENNFIGVQRAKIILDEIISSRKFDRSKIIIKDLGTLDYLMKSCDGTRIIIPSLPIEKCPSGVNLIAQIKDFSINDTLN